MELLTKDKKQLQIFEFFIVDRKLPKFQTGILPSDPSGAKMSSGVGGFNSSFGDTDSDIATPQDNVTWNVLAGSNGGILIDGNRYQPAKQSAFSRFFSGKKKEKVPVYRFTVEEFFKSIKNNAIELKRVDERVESFKLVLKQAKDFGQVALVEKLEDELEVIKSETQLYALKLTTIITEEQVVKFATDTEKGLHLDWIKNFTRIVPSKLLKIKQRADELKIFDNYAILHYDPKGKSSQLTKKEIEKKKDPILFGLIEGSRKLYYIGDWVDEHCDLTLEAFVDKFGKEVLDKNNITANIKGEV